MKQTFWQKNQVFISGCVSAITLTLQQFLIKPEAAIDWKVIGLAALIAVASYLGNEFRGKGITVAGFIGVAATAITTVQTTGAFTWNQFGFACLVGFLAMISPPAKPASYEQSATIQQAKEEAAVIKNVNDNTPPPQI
jgi:hypothetical protein